MHHTLQSVFGWISSIQNRFKQWLPNFQDPQNVSLSTSSKTTMDNRVQYLLLSLAPAADLQHAASSSLWDAASVGDPPCCIPPRCIPRLQHPAHNTGTRARLCGRVKRIHQPSAGLHGFHQPPSWQNRAFLHCRSIEPTLISPCCCTKEGGEQQWGSQSAQRQLQEPGSSGTGAVSRLANKRHEGWHVMVQLFKWPALGPRQFNSIPATAERTTQGRNGPR